MVSGDERDLRSRLASALAKARAENAEMLSVAFPRLPASAFDAIACGVRSRIAFVFENAEKHLAEAAFDFGEACVRHGKCDFFSLEKTFPKNRIRLSLSEKERSVPAPKIFAAGSFPNSEAAFAAIPTWQISRDGDGTHICAHIAIPDGKMPDESGILAEYEILKNASPSPEDFPAISKATEVGEKNYAERAARAIAAIEAGKFEKIVLARAKDFAFSPPGNFPSGTLYSELKKRFLASGCTLFSAQANGERIGERIVGATPEILVRVRKKELETEALAGTVPHDANAPGACAERLFSDAKERREHQIVVDFIAEKLRSVGLRPEYSELPQILRLPNVFHLHTPIKADIDSGRIPIGQIISVLHPTPAMCGVPASAAKEFICDAEPFSRENFSAPVGFLDADGNGFFAVAIRCAKIFEDKIRLYAGSGLVRGSDPQKEFLEIEAKISALASVFD